MEIGQRTEIGISRRDENRHDRESAILEAMKALIVERGFDAVTMDEIADRAGVSKPTLYKHFPSKDDIAIRAVVEKLQDGIAFVESLDRNQPAIERIQKIIHRMVMASYSPGPKCFGPAMRTAPMPRVRAHPEYKRAHGTLMSLIGRIVEEAKAEGSVPATLPIRPAIQMMVSILRDGGFDELIAAGECSVDELAAMVVNVLVGGFIAYPSQRTS